jgi:hypothetical protein
MAPHAWASPPLPLLGFAIVALSRCFAHVRKEGTKVRDTAHAPAHVFMPP